MVGKEFLVTPTLLAYGGEALARLPDGRAVFVPYALPGELVRIRITEDKRSHARAELLAIETPAAERISPRCPHFTRCGGCHYQHLAYEQQCQAKEEILRDQLARIGGLSEIPIQPTVPSANAYNYRNHIQFHLAPDGALGFQAAHANQVVPIQECHLPEDILNQVWPLLDIEPDPSLERVSLRSGAGDEVLLALECSDPQPLNFSVEELPISAVQLGPGGALVLAGSDSLLMEVMEHPFQVSAGSFFQVNTPQAAAMVAHLLEHLPVTPQSTLLDVYCGVGLFSAFFAPKVKRLVGIEIEPSACQDFIVNLDEFDHVELYEASAEEVLSTMQFKPEVILVDPPRAGLGAAVLEALLGQGAAWLAYVSCDPSTLARDARRLTAGGYRLERVTPFDLFPQTYHIESISLWRKTWSSDKRSDTF